MGDPFLASYHDFANIIRKFYRIVDRQPFNQKRLIVEKVCV